MPYCVYKHTAPNGKVYIGITCNDVKIRWKNGYGYKDGQPLFWNAIKKYGWDNFKHEILHDGMTEIEAKEKEIEMIALYKSNNREYGYNMTAGGDGRSCVVVSEETKQKLRIASTGRSATAETRQRMSESQKARYAIKPMDSMSEETRKKISIARKGIRSPNKGKFGRDNKTSKAVMCFSKDGMFLKEYGSTLEAQRLIGTSCADISKCCHGKRKTAGGYVWKYAE